ncbi:MAG: recombinase family protein [Intestinimonas sp.]|jgi:DNA invertase Pin-like site-specific DNA recombinase|nr:recombinase family protein [Intestinimonas sp.]
MPTEVKTAAAYIRVSTEDQMEYSPDAQMVEIRKYASTHGYLIPSEYIFVDEGISGKTTKRPAFNRMIGTAKRKPKPFDAILLWKFSRFARNREDSIVYKSMLRRQLGIDVLSVSEPLSDDKMSIIMEAMIEAMDEYYSINLAEEVKRGMTEKARRGGLQAPPPFGYRAENNILVPIPEEAALIRVIFNRFISGDGLRPIADQLNAIGVTTHRGNRFENRTVEYILRNPVYIGKLRWNPSGRTCRDFSSESIILSDARHEPIISLDTWEAAQHHMAEVKARWRYHSRPLKEHKDWISGLVRCASCGSTMIFSKPHYWKCNGYVRGSCKTSQHISDSALKDMLLTTIRHDCQDNVPIYYTVVRAKPEALHESSALKEHLQQLSKRQKRLQDAYLAGAEDLESYGTARAELQAQASRVREQIARLKSVPDSKETDTLIKKRIGQFFEVLANPESPLDEKKELAHSALEKCVFSRADNSIQIYYRFFPPDR